MGFVPGVRRDSSVRGSPIVWTRRRCTNVLSVDERRFEWKN
jgi:hypothetical protein